MAALAPAPKFYQADENGAPLAGGFVYTYISNTTTPLATYTDAGGGTANTNPVELDSAGRADIWLLPSSLYKFVVTNSSGVPIYTVNNIGGSVTLQQLTASSGSSLVGYLPAGASAVSTTVQAKLRESISVYDFMTAAQIADTQLTTPLLDVTTPLQAAIDYAKSFSAQNIERQLIWPAGSYRVTSLNFVGAARVRNTAFGNVNILGVQSGGTSIIDIDGGTSTSTARIAFEGIFAVQVGSGGSYSYGVKVSYVSSSPRLDFSVSGSYSVAAMFLDYSWDNTGNLVLGNSNTGSVHILKCGGQSVNRNNFFIRLTGPGTGVGTGTGLWANGVANEWRGDISGVQTAIDERNAYSNLFSVYTEGCTYSTGVSSGAGLGLSNTYLSCYFEVLTNGTGFKLGENNGTVGDNIIGCTLRGVGGGSSRTGIDYGTSAYKVTIVSPTFYSIGGATIDTQYTGTNRAATGGYDNLSRLPVEAVSFPPTQISSSDANTLDDYAEGTWTPSFTGLTVVLGGGTVTYSGTYTKVGRLVFWTAKIAPAGGATTASVAGTTYINNLLSSSQVVDGFKGQLIACDASGSSNFAVGLVTRSGGIRFGYTPTWAATANEIYISGTCISAT